MSRSLINAANEPILFTEVSTDKYEASLTVEAAYLLKTGGTLSLAVKNQTNDFLIKKTSTGLVSSAIYEAAGSGNIGVGNTTPLASLHVGPVVANVHTYTPAPHIITGSIQTAISSGAISGLMMTRVVGAGDNRHWHIYHNTTDQIRFGYQLTSGSFSTPGSDKFLFDKEGGFYVAQQLTDTGNALGSFGKFWAFASSSSSPPRPRFTDDTGATFLLVYDDLTTGYPGPFNIATAVYEGLIIRNSGDSTPRIQMGIYEAASVFGSIHFGNITASGTNYAIRGDGSATNVNGTTVALRVSDTNVLLVSSSLVRSYQPFRVDDIGSSSGTFNVTVNTSSAYNYNIDITNSGITNTSTSSIRDFIWALNATEIMRVDVSDSRLIVTHTDATPRVTSGTLASSSNYGGLWLGNVTAPDSLNYAVLGNASTNELLFNVPTGGKIDCRVNNVPATTTVERGRYETFTVYSAVGTPRIQMGTYEAAGAYGSIHFGDVTPSASNYIIASNGTSDTAINGPGQLRLVVDGTTRATVTSTEFQLSANLEIDDTGGDHQYTLTPLVDLTASRTVYLPGVDATTYLMHADADYGQINQGVRTDDSPSFNTLSITGADGTGLTSAGVNLRGNAPAISFYEDDAVDHNYVVLTSGGSFFIAERTDADAGIGNRISIPGSGTNWGFSNLGAGTGFGINLNAAATGDRSCFIDFICDDTYTDYGLRVSRAGGANNKTQLRHRGTGAFEVECQEAASIKHIINSATVYTANSTRLDFGLPARAKSYAVASLPTGAAGDIAYASDGRKNGEGVGSGTGVLVFSDGSNWIAVDTGQTVAA